MVDSSGNIASNSQTADCSIVVSPSTPLSKGDTATIGFWHNKNGQALINCVNGGSTATALATWLATNFPNLYGSTSSNDLTGKTNADVAALFLSFFGVNGQKTYAQILAGALCRLRHRFDFGRRNLCRALWLQHLYHRNRREDL